MERYCLRVVHPDYEGWWVVDPKDFAGGVPVGFGYAIAQHGAGVSSWEEPQLTTVQEDLQADGFDTIRITLEAAQQYMSS